MHLYHKKCSAGLRQVISILSLVVCLIASTNISGQKTDSVSFTNTIIPIAFFLPETSLGLGGTGITTFRNSSSDPELRPSQFIYSTVYTLRRQLLIFLPYEIYLKNHHVRLKGELGYYRFFYNYFGIGNNSLFEDLETYNVNFPRADFTYAYTWDRIFYIGGGFKFDQYDIARIEPNGLLDRFRPVGTSGGTKLNLLALAAYDTRDNLFAPDKGIYIEATFERSFPGGITPFDYQKFNLDIRTYFPLKEDWILALNLITSHASQETPFFDLPYISSPLRSRGFSDRRFLDYNLITTQAEIRYPIKGRFSGVGFVSPNLLYGGEWTNIEEAGLRLSYGVGFRFELNEEERTRVRLDIGSGNGELNFYITTNEAF